MPGGRLDFFAIPVGKVCAEAPPVAAAGAPAARPAPDPTTDVVVDVPGGPGAAPGFGIDPDPVGPPSEVGSAPCCTGSSAEPAPYTNTPLAAPALPTTSRPPGAT